MAAPPPPPPQGGLSLYENLLDPNDTPSASATISSAPVLYSQTEDTSAEIAVKKPIDPALRFQPIRRPQVKQATPKLAFPKPAVSKQAVNPAPPAPVQPKTTLADWAATEEDEWMYGMGEKRQRGGRKKKKKRQQEEFETNWDDIYDPTRPTNVEEYLHSDEKVQDVRDWKALLYRHRRERDGSDLSDEDEDEQTRHVPSNQFAPPSSYAFAPPPPQSPPAGPTPGDVSGDDAFARRVAISQGDAPPPAAQASPSQPSNSATISRAPVRYSKPHDDEDATEDKVEDDAYSPPPALGSSLPEQPGDDAQARSSRPGQSGFAHRLMSKYGWTKGSGLGADESGIVNPLRVQVEKRRKKADANGGGWAEPGGKGKIVGGKRKEENTGKFGTMSDVIVLRNMLENLPNLEEEIAGGLGQEIGEECGEKYGRVERLYIDQESRRVFIKFTNQVSALRAVNELDGRVFNGNTIVPEFFDTEKFEQG
ncbi:DNA-damage repair [Fusarium tjaetaba]|uniref:DNA-damage repair n=1 Tax=Fusarium tjaetaba TaxID=1567544 RepID=A0A8H5S8M3_9HYPO|nr:DNA-damage repair [Fusarium tjaetaba]KAF5646469.1 DNA-damage repair [Fusarium tjaetaba]